MSESADYISQLPQSPHTAEQLLVLLIKLVAKITDVEELTDDVIEATFGIQLDPSEHDQKDYAARLTPEWNVSVVVSDDEVNGRILELGFFDSHKDPVAALTDICGVDSDAFGTALMRAGFEQNAVHGVHGERQGQGYRRGSIEVLALTRGEANEPHDKIRHDCITSVWVHLAYLRFARPATQARQLPSGRQLHDQRRQAGTVRNARPVRPAQSNSVT